MSASLVADVAADLDGLPVVYVGGAVVGFHLDELQGALPRPTDDVDCVVAVTTRAEYGQVEGELRRRRFTQPLDEPGPICRWRSPGGIRVDVMPADPSILGFTSGWYPDVGVDAETIVLPGGHPVRVTGAARLFAMKVDAYRDRGVDDPWGSKDLEDLVSLLAGCSYLVASVRSAPAPLREAIRAFARTLLADHRSEEIVAAHCPRVGDTATRVRAALARLVELAH